MFHLSAFFVAGQSASQTAAIVPAVLDQSVNVQNQRIQLPEDRQSLAYHAAGSNLALAQVDSASLILDGRPIISPIVVAAPGGTLPGISTPMERGFILPGLELIGVLANTDASGAADNFAALFHTRRLMPAPPGRVKTVIATAASAGAKGLWHLSPLTFGTYLSAGRWAVTGMNVYGANVAYARLVFPNQMDRPGVIGTTGANLYVQDRFRYGRMGAWGTFDNYNPPQLETLGSGTLTTQTVLLDLVRVG